MFNRVKLYLSFGNSRSRFGGHGGWRNLYATLLREREREKKSWRKRKLFLRFYRASEQIVYLSDTFAKLIKKISTKV